ncbi:arylamine N-acetyltransferase family protein [Brachybacterium fresconis]|uniref:N-hydroxyarylamine O-acetyltransferase n=1 Tax=Brachybacterium fresconis TaxID=173363 RepID=A0ABS4YNC7_9MICO|nr:arylamine N-acetyltransferase [Brachybacterium fresconis]MBP2410296.1 N-hydroxyarylamine O-acetyltransferase [Brachybacterium fresconis]
MTGAAQADGADWAIDAFDPDVYFDRIGVEPGPPGLDLLERIHRAHVATFPFSNLDVLLGHHPGVDPDTVARRMLHEGTGGYCFEHAQLLAGVLERLGMRARRRLGRVHAATNTRTHMTVDIELEGRCWMLDPGFGLSVTGPIAREDGARREEWFGTLSMRRQERTDGVEQWELRRGEDLQHVTDLLPVVPADVRAGHHVTSTMPGAGPFTKMLIVSRFTVGGHVTVTSAARTIRRPGQETVHEELMPAQVIDAVADLGLPLDAGTARTLRNRLAEHAAG